jgi:acylphosphatase
MICRICWVSGRVQGVYYRATVARRARELAIAGHARNLRDGRVEVLACGEETAVQTFIEFLWIGSSASAVSAVEVAEATLREGQPPAVFLTA